MGTRFKTYLRTPALQVQPHDLPMLGVFILREKSSPWGDAHTAEPKFLTQLTLGLSGAVHAETANQNQLLELEQWMADLLEILLGDPKYLHNVNGPPTNGFGVVGMDRQAQYAKVGETTLFEIRIEMVVQFTQHYPPRVVDDFKTLHVETQFPDKEHAESGTPQIVRVYDIPQNE